MLEPRGGLPGCVAGGESGTVALRGSYGVRVGERAGAIVYVLAMVAVIVGVDVLFFRHQFWERLMVNVGIVLVFGAFYLRFLKHAA